MNNKVLILQTAALLTLVLGLLVLNEGLLRAQSNETDVSPLNLRLISIQNISEIGLQRYMVLSPDASTVIWSDFEQSQICLYTFSNAETSCTPYPSELLGYSGVFELKWSPNGRYVAFSENFPYDYIDPDIWIFDTQNLGYKNLTDDGFYGRVTGEETINLDYLPVWSSQSDLYFIRSVPIGENGLYHNLYYVPSRNGLLSEDTEEFVTGLATEYPGRLSFYNFDTYSLDGAVSISPDGTQIAIIKAAEETSGSQILLVNLSSGDIEILLTRSDIVNTGLPSWEEGEMVLASVGWASNGDGLVIIMQNTAEFTPIKRNAYYYDLSSDTVTTLMDFGDVPDVTTFVSERDEVGYNAESDVLSATVLSPDGELLFYVNDDLAGERRGISAIQLPPSDDANDPIRFTDVYIPIEDDVLYYFMDQTSIGLNDQILRILMMGYLFTFEVL